MNLTGCVTSSEHWVWRRMVFGLRNAPATFSRLVADVFEGLQQFFAAYLDDVWSLVHHGHNRSIIYNKSSTA